MTWLAGAALLLLAAFVPWPGRGVVRAAVVLAALLSPVVAFALWIATWEHRAPSAWFTLPVVTLLWLAWMDLQIGLTARWARPAARAERRSRPGPEESA